MRRFIALVTITAMALSLCACGDKTESSETLSADTSVIETSEATQIIETSETIEETTVQTTEETTEETEAIEETEAETEQTTAATTVAPADPDDGCLGDDFILN